MRASSFLVAVVVSVCAVVALGPAVARAEPKAAASAEAKERARAAYGRGQAAFKAGNYADSKVAFEQAFDAVPNPIVLLSIAESQAKLGEVGPAIATLQRYLSLRADAPDRIEIEGKIQALSATPATLSVTTDPDGADLDLDGFPTQKRAPAELELAPGQHTLDCSLSGYESSSETVVAEPGGKLELRITLQPLPPAPAELASTPAPFDASPEPDQAPSSRPTTAIWIACGVGAAGLVAGSVLGFLAMGEHSDFEKKPTHASADSGERLALFADVGFGVGVLGLATAAVLYFTSDDELAADETARAARAPRASLRLSPTAISATTTVPF